MLAQLLLENVRFALGLLAALTFLAIFWLHFDAWMEQRQLKEMLKWLGFFLLALGFLVYATVIEQTTFGQSLFGAQAELISRVMRLVAYLVLIAGHWLDPLPVVPHGQGLNIEATGTPAVIRKIDAMSDKGVLLLSVASLSLGVLLNAVPVIAAALVAYFYWRRATRGLERHLRPVAISFTLIAAFELFALSTLGRESINIQIAGATAAFGPLWFIQHIILVVALVLLVRWVWVYLTTRIRNQLFMIFTTATVVIFLLSTASFTFILFRNVNQESLMNLATASKVLDYALTSKKAETLALTETLAENPAVQAAVAAGNKADLVTLTAKFLETKKQSSLVITDAEGAVLLRAEDRDRQGESLSSDPLVERALIGKTATSVATKDGVLSPIVSIQSIAPIRNSGSLIVGSVTVGLAITNDFVDGIKRSTGLDAAIYSGQTRSATTFIAANGTSRLVGVKENSPALSTNVLKKGQTFMGNYQFLNTPYLAVFAPLKDVDNVPVGMIFVGRPQVAILQTAGRSVELTFLVAAILLLLAIVPIYQISAMISRQLR